MSHQRHILVTLIAFTAAACGGSASGGSADTSAELTIASPTETGEMTEPVETTEAEADVASESTTSTAAPKEVAPETTVSNIPAAPVKLRDGITLTSGWTYATNRFDVPFTYTIPEDTDGRYRVFQEATWFVATLMNVSPRNPDVRGDQQPGLGFSTVPIGIGVEDMVNTMIAFADERDDFELTRTTGLLRGEEVTILRGSSDVAGDRTFSIPTSGESFTLMPQGPREFILFVIDVEGRPVMADINADPLQFDLMVKNGLATIESLEFM